MYSPSSIYLKDEWDQVLCVRYPSPQKFLEITDPPAISPHSFMRRWLERTALFAARLGVRLSMGRKILFITTDQQRWDSLGCNGNKFCSTPNIDALAKRRHQLYARLQPEHRLHAGALDHADRAICPHPWRLRQWRAVAGKRAELCAISEGQGRLQNRADRQGAFRAGFRSEVQVARTAPARRRYGPWRGFDYAIHAMHIANFRGRPVGHYGRWLKAKNKEFFNAGRRCSTRHPAAIPARRRLKQPHSARALSHRLAGRPRGGLAEAARRR